MEEAHRLCQLLMEANQSAFNQKCFPEAYHALSGAMHCAYRLKDAQRMQDIEQLALTQWDYLKAHTLAAPNPFWSEPSQETLLALYRSLARLARSRFALL